jgi:hypothetical protein
MHRTFSPKLRLGRRLKAGVSAAAILAPLVIAGQAGAVQFGSGDFKGSFDTTLTVGALFRVQDRDPDLVGFANGGNLPSMNGDNGNLNYNKGLVSLAGRATHELKLTYKDVGAFVRATYFYDEVNSSNASSSYGRTDRFALSDEAVDRVGRGFDLLDAFIYTNFDLTEDASVGVRLGNQVLSWGESTFIPNGINTINPVNVSALRVPGSELKEAFVPVPVVDLNFSLGEYVSLELFYQFKWDNTEPEAANTYFSSNEAATPGARYLFIGFGHPAFRDVPTQGAVPAAAFPASVRNVYTGQTQAVRDVNGNVLVGPQSLTGFGTIVPRLDDDKPQDSGQYGAALRLFVPQLNDAEIGAYFINYHSRLPVLSTFVGSFNAFATSSSTFTQASGYKAEYPEDIKLFGLSFNTVIPGTGVSLQGEYSFRKDQPLQFDDVELLQATLAAPTILALIGQGQAAGSAAGSAQFTGAVNAVLAATPSLAPFRGLTFEQIQAASPAAAAAISAGIAASPGSPGGTRAAFQAVGAASGANQGAAGAAGLFNTNQIIQRIGLIPGNAAGATAYANTQFGSRIAGWDTYDVSQFQATATKAFGPLIGANQWVLVAEVGGTYVHDMPSANVLRLDGPGTVVGGNPVFNGRGGMPYSIPTGFATEFSWGYRASARFDYLNAIAGINLFPSISWSQDVSGTTPSPISNFLEGRKALSVGLRALYKEAYTIDLGYSAFWGAGSYNAINDRDFVSVSFKYSF